MRQPAAAPETPSRTMTAQADLRTGADYLASLADGRQVILDGEPVADVATHPAFAGAAASIAALFDCAADPANRDAMTYASPDSGRPVWRTWQIPRSGAELGQRREFHRRWAELTFGLMGRSPDHVASAFTGYAAKPSVFERSGGQWARNVQAFYREAREGHLFVSYAVVPPQIDRSKAAHQQSDPTLYAGVVAERDGGIVLRGAQQLATSAALSDCIQVSCVQPLRPGDEAHAFSVAIPANAPGLKLYQRRPYAPQASSLFDYPLTSRFDEPDSLVVLQDVFVPWEKVFIYRDIGLCRDQWWATPAHAYSNLQAQVRYSVKLRLLVGIARRMVEMTGTAALPPVIGDIGELAALATLVESGIEAQVAQCEADDEGVFWTGRAALYAVMSLQAEFNGRMLEAVRELAGSAMVTLPSSVEDYRHAGAAADLERYVTNAGGDALGRVALMRLAWDLVGTEFAGRQQQYEKFYGGPSFVVRQTMARHYDFDRANDLVERALAASRADLAARLARGTRDAG